jgi:hypothetical protein
MLVQIIGGTRQWSIVLGSLLWSLKSQFTSEVQQVAHSLIKSSSQLVKTRLVSLKATVYTQVLQSVIAEIVSPPTPLSCSLLPVGYAAGYILGVYEIFRFPQNWGLGGGLLGTLLDSSTCVYTVALKETRRSRD